MYLFTYSLSHISILMYMHEYIYTYLCSRVHIHTYMHAHVHLCIPTLHQKLLAGGVLTSGPLFCLICTIISIKIGHFD